MNLCAICGANYPPCEVQEITIDLEKLYVCDFCAKQALLIAGQVKVPGWIAAVWQPRNLSHLVSQRGYLLDQEQVISLAESGHAVCECRLNDAYHEYWNDFGLEKWLESQKPMA